MVVMSRTRRKGEERVVWKGNIGMGSQCGIRFIGGVAVGDCG